MNKEKWFDRTVSAGEASDVYGCVKFEGQVFEPTTPGRFIRIGHKVQVRRLTGATWLIAVRRRLDDGTFGGVETWQA